MQGAPTVVVVDDASEVRLLLRTRMRISGMLEVLGEASNGADAVSLAEKHRPDLMLLDVSMPAVDGLEALPRVLQVSPETKVVLYSGFEEQGLAERALELGASAFVEKSVPIDELIDRLLRVLDRPEVLERHEPQVAAPAPYVTRGPLSVDQHVLDEHLERFREVFEEAAIGMATMTLTGNVVRANRALAALLRRTPGELVGTFYGDVTAGGAGEVAACLETIRREPVEVVQLEHRISLVDDGRRVLATFAPVRDSMGRPLYVFLQVQDVTAEREMLEALRKSEERFRLLVAAVEDYAIFMLDPDGRVASWNAGAERSQGYAAEEIIGQHFRVFYPPEVAARKHPEHELELAVRDGHYSEEGWRIRKDGSRFWAYVVITAVYDDTGRLLGFAKVTRDITERREAERILRQSEERFRLLVETVEDYAIFMLDPDGRVASWNAGAQRNQGYTAEEIIGQHFRVFYPPEVAARKHPEHELELAVRDGHYEEEGWRIRKDGSRFWANVLITAVLNDDGRHIGFTKVTRDITERRRLEQEREQAVQALASANAELESLNQRLKQAADDQSQFLAVTAHELRTPVGVLGGSAEMLAQHWDELEEGERQEMFAAMTASTARLRRLLDDLLTASRLQGSKLEMRSETVGVAEIARDAVSTVRRTHPEGEIQLLDIPDLAVVGDRDRLAQALENLVTNALRHGKPPVQVGAEQQGDRVVISVRDHGSGVSEQVLGRLFERFATGRAKGGTGLGLFIVRELARAHGGDARYEPDGEGRGPGAFVIDLPVASRAQDAPSNPSRA